MAGLTANPDSQPVPLREIGGAAGEDTAPLRASLTPNRRHTISTHGLQLARPIRANGQPSINADLSNVTDTLRRGAACE
jgi:hypothetical protein